MCSGTVTRAPGGSTFVFLGVPMPGWCASPAQTAWNCRFGTGKFGWAVPSEQSSCAGACWSLPCCLAAAVELCWVPTSAGAAALPGTSGFLLERRPKHMPVGFCTSFQIALIMCLNVQQKILQRWAAQRTRILSSPAAFGLFRSPPTATVRACSKVHVLQFRALPGR